MASSAKNWRWLVEWTWPSATYRYASFEDVTHDGHVWQNRIRKVAGLGGRYIDRKEAEFGDLVVTLCNLADDGSTNFPFHLLDAADDFEDKEIRVYLYDATADTKSLVWFGITKRPDFDPDEFTCSIAATFPWDAIDIKVPTVPLGHLCPYAFGGSSYETADGTVPSPGCPYPTYGTPGFTSCGKTFGDCESRGMLAFFGGWTHIAPVLHDDTNNLVDRDKVRAGVVPLVYGTGDIKIKPEIYRAVIRDSELICNFIISGTHNGLPFDAAQIDASRLKLGGVTRATYVEFYTGVINQAIPGNRTLFPEATGHSFVAYGVARFPLTKEQIDKFSDNVPFHAVRARIDGGRKTLRSSGQTENPVYVLEDVLRDPIYGLGLPVGSIDSSAVTAAASFVGTRFRGRFEIDRPEPLLDYVQRSLATWGGYITFNAGLMQIGAKRDDETAVATFGTGGGHKIIDHEAVTCTEEDFADLVNDLVVRYRAKMRQKREFAYADYGAQIKAGNGLKKVSTEELFLEGIYDDDEAAIAAAVWLREEQNLNLQIEFKTPLDDWQTSGAAAGKVIRVNSPHIWNNGSNYLFRVTGYDIDAETFVVKVRARVYKQSVYAYNADPINGDILRDGGDTSIAARPPDVTSVAAAITDVFTDDDDDRMARIHCTWAYPDVSSDHAQDNLEGIYPEYPIEAVTLYWRYTDESINDLKLGSRVQYPTAAADLVVPFHRSRQVEVWFVAVGRNNGQAALGYNIDPAQTTFLDGDLTATAFTFDVGSTAAITAGEYLRCESELMLVDSVSSPSVTVANAAAVRTPQFDTDAEAHPDGTEIGVAVKSHPTATVDMTARRHTLAQVTGVVTRSRPRGVRVKWTNLPNYDNEKYFLYWSVTGDLDDADTFVASWSSQDPKTPPAGINLVKCGKKAHHLIPQEDIDTAYGGDASGISVQVRVAAKIKNNYSTALSALPGDSPGHHNRPWAPPADPIAGDITQEVVATSDRVKVTTRVYATSDRTTGTPRTWDQVNSHIAGLVFEKYNKAGAAWSGVFVPVSEEIEDPDSSFQDIERTFHKGSRWRIRRAFARNPGSKRAVSSLVLLEFQVGSQSDVLSGITDLAIAAFGSDENTDSIELDGNDSQLLVTWTQPGTPVTLRELQIRKKKTTATKWRRVPAVQLLDRVDDNGNPFNDAVVPAKAVRVDVHHPRGVTMDFEVRLVGADGDTTTWASINRSTTDDAGGGDLPIRSDGAGPSYPSSGHVARNHVIGDAALALAEVAFTPYHDGTTGDNDFGTPDATYGPIRDVTIVLQARNAANTTNVGQPIRITADVDPATGTLAAPAYIEARLEAGVTYVWRKTVYRNSDDRLERDSGSASSPSFVAGASSYVYDAATALSSESMSRVVSDNRHSVLTVNATQAATPALLKEAVFEVQYASGGWLHALTKALLAKAGKFSVAGAIAIKATVQHRKARTADLDFRVVIVPFGVDYETGDSVPATCQIVSLTAQTSTDDGYAPDNNNPGSAATAPTILKATIGPAGLTCRCSKPSDARPYLQRYEYQFANATSGAGTDWLDPDLGTIALLNTNPTAGDVALAAATFTSDHRFTASDTQKRDLDVAFKNGTAQGVLALFVRARIVDLDDAGAVRNGTWSGFTAVTHRRAVDQDSDVRNVGTGNLVDGGNCDTDSGQYSPAAGTTTTIGRHMSLSPSGAGTRITTSTSKIFWDKTRRCVSINNTNNSNQLCIRLYGVLTPEQIYWLTFAIRGQASSFNPGSIVAALYDAGGAVTKASVAINRTLSNGTYDLIGVKFDLTGVSAWTGNPWLIFDPPNTWTSGIIDITRIKLAPGPTPTLFERGAQEVGLDASSGVGLGDIGGLAALERNVSLNVEGITTWGVLATT